MGLDRSAPRLRPLFQPSVGAVRRKWYSDCLGRPRCRPSGAVPLFGVSDDVDLSQLEWKRGNYDTTQLSNLYTCSDARAANVIRELRDKVTNPDLVRAIGFCVSVQHAHYMAEVFNRAGIVSVAVDGGTNDADRATALERLGQREINRIFAVDLFNEGLDLPQVDTILLLRPTQSATIFLQQLGRGAAPCRGQGGADRHGFHRPAAPRVPLRSALPGADRLWAEGAGESRRR